MTAQSSGSRIDTSRAHPARVYDWLLGGKDNYPVDQEVAEKLPPESRLNAQRNRAFMHRAAAWLAGNGIDQFLDVGTGIPTEPNLHQIVQGIVPSARVAYTDNDPIVLRHAEALLVSTPQGRPTTSRQTSVSPRSSSTTPVRSWTSPGPSRCRCSP